MTRKEKVKQLLFYHSKLPMPKEYIALLNMYTKKIYQWLPHINNATYYIKLEGNGEIKGRVTARSMELLEKVKPYIENVNEVRTYMLMLSSVVIFVGGNYPSDKALVKLTRLLEKLEGIMIDNFVIINRYKKAINNHTKLNLKSCKEPEGIEKLEDSDDWPSYDIMRSFIEHGLKMMDLKILR